MTAKTSPKTYAYYSTYPPVEGKQLASPGDAALLLLLPLLPPADEFPAWVVLSLPPLLLVLPLVLVVFVVLVVALVLAVGVFGFMLKMSAESAVRTTSCYKRNILVPSSYDHS